jgi:hypothetical protein
MSEKRDPLGNAYDHSWTDADGETHYIADHAGNGTAAGSAEWSSSHDCNPICGHHLADKCHGCGVCTVCDGCYCLEDEY